MERSISYSGTHIGRAADSRRTHRHHLSTVPPAHPARGSPPPRCPRVTAATLPAGLRPRAACGPAHPRQPPPRAPAPAAAPATPGRPGYDHPKITPPHPARPPAGTAQGDSPCGTTMAATRHAPPRSNLHLDHPRVLTDLYPERRPHGVTPPQAAPRACALNWPAGFAVRWRSTGAPAGWSDLRAVEVQVGARRRGPALVLVAGAVQRRAVRMLGR